MGVVALALQLSKFRPVLVVCGGTGVGKTTLVNALVGRAVGAVGHFARGTDHPQRHRAQLAGREFDLIDLPGLGDAEERDRLYKPMYVAHLRFASGVILVITPPRLPRCRPSDR